MNDERPEGPIKNSPGRQAGVTDAARQSAEGAAHVSKYSAAPSVLILPGTQIPA